MYAINFSVLDLHNNKVLNEVMEKGGSKCTIDDLVRTVIDIPEFEEINCTSDNLHNIMIIMEQQYYFSKNNKEFTESLLKILPEFKEVFEVCAEFREKTKERNGKIVQIRPLFLELEKYYLSREDNIEEIPKEAIKDLTALERMYGLSLEDNYEKKKVLNFINKLNQDIISSSNVVKFMTDIVATKQQPHMNLKAIHDGVAAMHNYIRTGYCTRDMFFKKNMGITNEQYQEIKDKVWNREYTGAKVFCFDTTFTIKKANKLFSSLASKYINNRLRLQWVAQGEDSDYEVGCISYEQGASYGVQFLNDYNKWTQFNASMLKA